VALVSVLAGCGGRDLDAKREVQTWWEAKRIVDSCDTTGDMWHTSTVYACQTHDPNGIRGSAKEEHGYYGLRWDACRLLPGPRRSHRVGRWRVARKCCDAEFKAELHDNLACPPGFDFCGKGLVHGFGTATTTLNFTGAEPGPGDCLMATAVRTITLDSDGSTLLISIAGTICDQKLSGTYAVISGTGAFAGATGSGTLDGTATGVPVQSTPCIFAAC
jgi:hypothetical protein